jgi:hypothetical protein
MPACDNSGLSGLLEILSWARPHDSDTERAFCKAFLDPVPGMTKDAFGNRMVRIGDSRIMWSCHVDTVAAKGGAQLLRYDPETGVVQLAQGKPGMSLGADDGAGIWIMLNMIAEKIPGLYVFHRGEEQGCLGSRWLKDHTPDVLAGIDAAIAFDRAHFADVITHQSYGRTCSDAFAVSMSAGLNGLNPGFRYEPDDTGVYTDTNEYAGVIPECTNLSVGYLNQHGPKETLDALHCMALLDAMLKLDHSKLVIERDPSVEDFAWGWASSYKTDPYLAAVEDNPRLAVELLREAGIGLDEFRWAEMVEGRCSAWDDDYRPLASA